MQCPLLALPGLDRRTGTTTVFIRQADIRVRFLADHVCLAPNGEHRRRVIGNSAAEPERPISWVIQIALSIKTMHLRARQEKALGKDEQLFIVAVEANPVQIEQSAPGDGLAPEPVGQDMARW
jgi:hypothetical protein